MSRVPETYEPKQKYGHIEVGQFYDASNHPACILDGIVEVTEIRFWSDGLRDVELKQKHATAYVRLDLLMRDDPETGEPLFNKVEQPQEE
jgi:hypothetical protein